VGGQRIADADFVAPVARTEERVDALQRATSNRVGRRRLTVPLRSFQSSQQNGAVDFAHRKPAVCLLSPGRRQCSVKRQCTADDPSPGHRRRDFVDGNFIDTTVAADQQVTFEGRVDTKGNTDPTDDTNVNFDVIVGQTSYGVLLIPRISLRDGNLIIGDSGHI
jgi:hypothetical protein